jgi:thiamine biosynthesis protein ThiS
MNLRVNGELREIPAGCTVTQLLELLEIRVKHVAVERNGLIAPRATHAELELADGDELEVVTLVGGG